MRKQEMIQRGPVLYDFLRKIFAIFAVNGFYSMNDFAIRLKNEILKGLPGTDIQWQMASSDRFVRNFPRTPGKDARIAAVLILLYPHAGSVYTVFMQRPDYDGVHGGQISFPGGKKESGDENVVQTALREAAEETGVDPAKISITGTLTPLFIPVSNMVVTPVVGWTDRKPEFNFQPEEVEFLIEADLKILLDSSIVKTKPFEIRGEILDVKYFDYNGNTIWGATAMIFNELLSIIRKGGFFHQE
jgi:8-oxo-dGTP pyrophosphatase MutT (NUDIX family)